SDVQGRRLALEPADRAGGLTVEGGDGALGPQYLRGGERAEDAVVQGAARHVEPDAVQRSSQAAAVHDAPAQLRADVADSGAAADLGGVGDQSQLLPRQGQLVAG